MRGVVPVELPEAAREKLAEITLARDSHLEAARSAQARANMLPPDSDKLHERLAAERDKHAEKHRLLHLVVSRCNQFCMELRGVTLESVEPAAVRLKNGETPNSAIAATREEIKTLRERLAIVKASPLPASDQVELAKEFVARRALVARSKILVQQDALRVHWADDVVMSKSDIVSLLCCFLPEQVLAALQEMIGEQSPNAMPAAERDKRIARITQRLFELELQEESLILKAHGDGIDVMRRGDADPRAVLGVIVRSAQEAQAKVA
jgi:hypothetical protein